MSQDWSRSRVCIDVGRGEQPLEVVAGNDTPFQILVTGDFSGRANRGVNSAVTDRRPVLVDCDNLDSVLAGMGVSVRLPEGTFRFRELNDFHPDSIYRSTALFQGLQEMRARASPPALATARIPRQPLQPGKPLLDRMMEEADGGPGAPVLQRSDDLAAFVKEVVAPYVVPRDDPFRQEWVAQIDAAAGIAMRAILHHADFQSLEAVWRAVHMLVQRLQPDSELKVYILDARIEELIADLASFERLLADSEYPWALLIGGFAFGQSELDVMRLQILGRIAATSGAPFLAEAQPLEQAEATAAWQSLRRSREARWVGLALPRFLLRLPYGKATAPVESFDFEEMPESVHTQYLWGNPAFCCACLLGQAFRRHGWDRGSGIHQQLDGLPLHVYAEDGETIAKPCAEVLLTETDAEFLVSSGFMPVMSMRHRDSVVVVRFQSLEDPPSPLPGPWRQSF